jgi:hypothetical protein
MVDVPARGFHATHDEMWELYVHSRFWFYTNAYFGWNVALSYQVLSCVAGSAFVYVLLTYCQGLVPKKSTWAFLGCIAGGYMQLFFGDMENYTIMTALVMAYFLASLRFLARRGSVVWPSVLLTLALTFHLEAGFLVPSLAYLLVMAWRRNQQLHVSVALASTMAIVAGTLFFFHAHGLPIGDLFTHSHAFGDDGHFREMLVTPSVGYYVQIATLSVLLAPAWMLLVPLLVSRRIAFDAVNVHLLIASAAMMAFVLGWKAQLGVYNDWNLFAMAAVPISLLVWRNVFGPLGAQPVPKLVVAAIALFLANSYSWIVMNHFK